MKHTKPLQKYRVVYWLGSMTTETVVVARSHFEATTVFTMLHGDHEIVAVEKIAD